MKSHAGLGGRGGRIKIGLCEVSDFGHCLFLFLFLSSLLVPSSEASSKKGVNAYDSNTEVYKEPESGEFLKYRVQREVYLEFELKTASKFEF